MKLGKLNAAIDAAPNVYGQTYMGPVALQKGSLKALLKAHHDGDRSAETGRKLDKNGVFVIDEGAPE